MEVVTAVVTAPVGEEEELESNNGHFKLFLICDSSNFRIRPRWR